jgi:hypothetical protein
MRILKARSERQTHFDNGSDLIIIKIKGDQNEW